MMIHDSFDCCVVLVVLQQWKEAEDAFEVVLALDPSCTDAWVELKKIRAYQLQVGPQIFCSRCSAIASYKVHCVTMETIIVIVVLQALSALHSWILTRTDSKPR